MAPPLPMGALAADQGILQLQPNFATLDSITQ